MFVYLSAAQLEELHDAQLSLYGGGTGLRDREALDAATARPAMTFGGEDLYPDVAGKTAALMHGLVTGEPFVDGNKRVGAQAALLLLALNSARAEISSHDLEEVTLLVAHKELDTESLAIWFRQRIERSAG